MLHGNSPSARTRLLADRLGHAVPQVPHAGRVRHSAEGFPSSLHRPDRLRVGRRGRNPHSGRGVTRTTDGAALECDDLQSAHGVVVGRDWGTLPVQQQRRWTALGCDSLVS